MKYLERFSEHLNSIKKFLEILFNREFWEIAVVTGAITISSIVLYFHLYLFL